MRVLGVALAVVLGIAAVGRAEPLDLTHVAADAKWVIHFDVDALYASTVVQKAYHKCTEMHPNAKAKLDLVAALLGTDLRKDIHGVTVYGRDTDKQHGVMICHAKVNPHLLLALVAIAPDHKVLHYGSYELHQWTAKCGKHGPHTAVGTFYKPDVLLLGGSPEVVKAALNVLDGKSAGISGSGSPLAGRILPGSIFIARASAIDPSMRCPVLQKTESFRVALGESNGRSFYRARLVMKSPEPAEQVKQVVDGFRALVLLHRSSDPLAMKLIDGLKATNDGAKVNIRWTASAADVWTALEKAANKWAEHHSRHAHPMPCQGGSLLHQGEHKAKPQPKHEEEEF